MPPRALPIRWPRRDDWQPRSMRRWLLSASLLAVLAGYALLLAFNRALERREQTLVHRATAEAITAALADGRLSVPPQSPGATAETLCLQKGSLAWLEPPAAGRRAAVPSEAVSRCLPIPAGHSTAELIAQTRQGAPERSGAWRFGLGDERYLASVRAVPLSQGPRRLLLLQAITASGERTRTTQLMLLVAAGCTALLTSSLLRVVLNRGLRPLALLAGTMNRIESETLGENRIPAAAQPSELQPIAEAFNGLLNRLAVSFEQQRSFVNGVSHELRTPITLIGGYANRLRRRGSNLRPEQRQQLELIATEASRMGRLVDELLQLARSDAGRLQLSCIPTDPVAVLQQVVERLAEHADGRLMLEAHTPGEFRLEADPSALEQCLSNLVENALKYAPAASPIRLALSRSGDQGVLHVIDGGPGVPEPDREVIFERFSRGPAAIGSELPGSGIGLAVVRSLMRAMGGEVSVADAPGGGADFQLRLPIAEAANPSLLNVLPSTDIPTASIGESLRRERDGR